MTKKIRIILLSSAISVLCLMLVLTIMGIFAEEKIVFNTNTNVNYTSNNVAATAQANVYVGKNVKVLTTDGKAVFNGNNQLKFDASKIETKNLQSQGEINPIIEDEFVVYEYIFKNTSFDEDFKASLYFVGIAKNVTITTYNSSKKLSNFEAILLATSKSSEFTTSAIVSKDETRYFYVKVAVSDKTQNASFKGDFSWTLI